MPNTRLHFLIFPIYAVLLVKEMEFFSLFLLLGEIRRVLSGKMATNQLKISQKIDIDSFQCIDWHREVIKVTLCVNFMTNRHLNSNTKHCGGGQIMPTTLLLAHPDLKTQWQLCNG